MSTPETLLLVRHGRDRVAVNLAAVREVLRMVYVKPIPGAPRGVLGVINLRGETIAVVDLEARLPADAGAPGLDHHLVVLNGMRVPVAVAVARVDNIEPLADGAWREAGDVLPKGVPVLGVARLGEELVPVLDTASLLEPGEVMKLQEALRRLSEAG